MALTSFHAGKQNSEDNDARHRKQEYDKHLHFPFLFNPVVLRIYDRY
jgi:hypothetical protein